MSNTLTTMLYVVKEKFIIDSSNILTIDSNNFNHAYSYLSVRIPERI